MKKIMWIVAMIPVVVTSVVLQFMPDVIPMHHDLEGNTDRWGSKTESLIFPIIILFITLFWHLLINVFEKKSITAKTEKEQMEAKSSAKDWVVFGFCMAIMLGIMHCFILYLHGYKQIRVVLRLLLILQKFPVFYVAFCLLY